MLFEKNNNFDYTALFHSIASVFEYANTDLYILNKGVLLTNVLSHAHVSLNKKQTKILGEAFEKEVPDTRKKTKNISQLKIYYTKFKNYSNIHGSIWLSGEKHFHTKKNFQD